MPTKHQVARVAVADEQWVAFRQVALAQGVSVSGDSSRRSSSAARAGRSPVLTSASRSPSRRSVRSEVRAAIDELDAIAGRLARSAISHGASWADVGSSLRLSGDAAWATHAKDS